MFITSVTLAELLFGLGAMPQGELHYAIHGHTAAEVIVNRAVSAPTPPPSGFMATLYTAQLPRR